LIRATLLPAAIDRFPPSLSLIRLMLHVASEVCFEPVLAIFSGDLMPRGECPVSSN
jgi:hypothetical protein